MAHRYYHICSSNIGRVATIRTYDGGVYSGRISRVTDSHVYLAPVGGGISGKDNKEVKNLAKIAVASEKDEKGSEVFFFFFPFAAIAALTFAAAATPFYGSGFGHGFGRRPLGRRRFFY
jgi:hypothetical protein